MKIRKIKQNKDKYYIEFDGIRLIYERGNNGKFSLTGWYQPELKKVI